MYAITAVVVYQARNGDGVWGRAARQVPTFYLDENVQGILSESHAAEMARTIIDPLGQIWTDDLHITAVKL